jgi:hypothetical protein
MMPATWVPCPYGSTLVSAGATVGVGLPTTSTTPVRVWMSGCKATPESTTAIVTPAPFSALSGAGATGWLAASRAMSIALLTGSSVVTKSTRPWSASAATRLAGRRTETQRDDVLKVRRSCPPNPLNADRSADPGSLLKRTRTSMGLLPLPRAISRARELRTLRALSPLIAVVGARSRRPMPHTAH